MPRCTAQRARGLLLDGEVVAFDGEQTSFSRLQQRLGVTRPSRDLVAAYPVVYCVFDLLEVDGEDLTGRPLLERRARLARAIRPRPALQLSEAWRGDSERRFAEACRSGWEGLIAKRADAPYARALAGLAEAEVRVGAGARHRRLHRSGGQPDGLRRPARRLLRGRPAPVRRQGRDRLHRGDASRPRRPATRAGDARLAIRGRSTGPTRHALDAARAGSPDRLRRVDDGRAAATAALPRTARRQAPRRGRPGATPVRPAPPRSIPGPLLVQTDGVAGLETGISSGPTRKESRCPPIIHQTPWPTRLTTAIRRSAAGYTASSCRSRS